MISYASVFPDAILAVSWQPVRGYQYWVYIFEDGRVWSDCMFYPTALMAAHEGREFIADCTKEDFDCGYIG
jgi:hypothetical protein